MSYNFAPNKATKSVYYKCITLNVCKCRKGKYATVEEALQICAIWQLTDGETKVMKIGETTKVEVELDGI